MSGRPRQDSRLHKVLAALHVHGGRGRSSLSRWMRRHHDALAVAFTATPPAWGAFAAELAAADLTAADGKRWLGPANENGSRLMAEACAESGRDV